MSDLPEVRDAIGLVPDPDPVLQRRAALNLVSRLDRLPDDTTHADLFTVLQALGLAPYESPASTDANGMTVYPQSQRDRRARNREAS